MNETLMRQKTNCINALENARRDCNNALSNDIPNIIQTDLNSALLNVDQIFNRFPNLRSAEEMKDNIAIIENYIQVISATRIFRGRGQLAFTEITRRNVEQASIMIKNYCKIIMNDIYPPET